MACYQYATRDFFWCLFACPIINANGKCNDAWRNGASLGRKGSRWPGESRGIIHRIYILRVPRLQKWGWLMIFPNLWAWFSFWRCPSWVWKELASFAYFQKMYSFITDWLLLNIVSGINCEILAKLHFGVVKSPIGTYHVALHWIPVFVYWGWNQNLWVGPFEVNVESGSREHTSCKQYPC